MVKENVESLSLSWTDDKKIEFTSEEAPILRFKVNGKVLTCAMHISAIYKAIKKDFPEFEAECTRYLNS